MSYDADQMTRHSWTTNELCLPLITKVVRPHRAEERRAFLMLEKKKFTMDNQTRNILSSSNKGLTSSDMRDSSQLAAMNAAGLVLNQEDTLKHLNIAFDCSKVDDIRMEEQRRRSHRPTAPAMSTSPRFTNASEPAGRCRRFQSRMRRFRRR